MFSLVRCVLRPDRPDHSESLVTAICHSEIVDKRLKSFFLLNLNGSSLANIPSPI